MRTIMAAAALVLLAGCGAESKAPPVSTSSGIGPTSQMPQSPNSLPRGSAVAAPLDRSRINAVTVP